MPGCNGARHQGYAGKTLQETHNQGRREGVLGADARGGIQAAGTGGGGVNRLPPPNQSEWDFRKFINLGPEHRWQLLQCYEWEYYREVYGRRPRFKKAVDNWRLEHPLTDEGFHGQPFDMALICFSPEEDKISPLWFVAFPDWPERPYVEANVWNPNADFIQYPKEGHGLQVDLEEIVQFPPDLEWQHWPAGSVLASSSDSIVALHLDWTRPLEDIKRQVDQWLSWAHKHVANRPERRKEGNANPLKQAQTALKQLTAMRLLAGRSWKEACEIYGHGDLYSDQAGWINAVRSAEKRVKNMGDEWG